MRIEEEERKRIETDAEVFLGAEGSLSERSVRQLSSRIDVQDGVIRKHLKTHEFSKKAINKKNFKFLNQEALHKIHKAAEVGIVLPEFNDHLKVNELTPLVHHYCLCKFLQRQAVSQRKGLLKMLESGIMPNACFEKVLEEGAQLDERDDSGNSVLMLAAKQGNVFLVDLLADYGADVNVRNVYKDTALHFAAKELNDDLILKLAEHEANPNIKNCKGLHPFDYIAKHELQRLDTLKSRRRAYIKKKAPELLKVENSFFKDSKKYQDLVSRFMEKEEPNKSLHEYLMSFLIEHGYHVDSSGIDKRSPLMDAIYFRMQGLFDAVMERNPDLDQVDVYGNTALHYAAVHAEGAKLDHCEFQLLTHEANPNRRNDDKRTPLHLLFKYLKGSTADPFERINCYISAPITPKLNLRDYKGKTVLHYCGDRYENKSKSWNLLIEAGASRKIRDKKGFIPQFLHGEAPFLDWCFSGPVC